MVLELRSIGSGDYRPEGMQRRTQAIDNHMWTAVPPHRRYLIAQQSLDAAIRGSVRISLLRCVARS